MILKYLEQQKVDCVMVIPATNSPWVNLVSSYIVDLMEVSLPYDHKTFSVLNNNGKRIPKKYPQSMIAVKLQFSSLCKPLNICMIKFCIPDQIDEEIQRIDDENFIWLMNHYANPQGGLELFDKITHLDLNN